MGALTAIEKSSGPSELQLEQAIYGSRSSTLQRGYHVLAKSRGVSGETVTELNKWCPSHGSLLDNAEQASSLNFHPAGSDLFALSRTVYGEREFSNRGGLQVVTMILILNKYQLAQYDNNPFAIARVARSWGLLRWHPSCPRTLPAVTLPCAFVSETTRVDCKKWTNIRSVIDAVNAGNSVALTSSDTCTDMLESVILQVSSNQRLQFSFTTGLKPSPQRPFRLHLVDEMNSQLRRTSFQNLSVVQLMSE